MVVIRSTNEIILSLIDFLRLTQPNADTKSGTVIRNLVIDAPANQLGLLYDELSKISTQQSLRLVIGADLDKLAKNFGLVRKSASPSSGIALLTFSSIPAVVNINNNNLITASNGFAYIVLNGTSVVPSQLNFYKSIATKFRNDLNFVGITDQYAVEVTVQATVAGVSGNIGKYSLNNTNISGVSNVTNVASFTGGSNQEDDATFRNRILSVFSGSSVGTALGYRNSALAVTDVQDAVVIGPGNALMTRDGSIVTQDNNGNFIIVTPGSGGKVDIYVLGTNLVQNTDSFIYQDKSNTNDPTSSLNNVVLGQIAADANLTISAKRITDIANNQLPNQPVDSLIQVTGSSSGSNFVAQTIDSLGRTSGNFKLIKDTGFYAGSPWGFDTFAWTSNQVAGFSEDVIKGQFNGQDASTFSDVLQITQAQQNIPITNENSQVLASNRSLIQLLHTPATNVTRVFNVNTGERYTITNQNPGGSGNINTSGIIQITGNTLPSTNDTLQVDYTWVVSFDRYSDFDGLSFTNNLRSVSDSVDWGYSNLVRNERINFTRNTSNTFFVGNSSLPVSNVISAKTFIEIDAPVVQVTSGIFAGRLSVVTGNLVALPTAVNNIYLKNTYTEAYVTAQNNGSFSVASVVVGLLLEYTAIIILPTDTSANVGDTVTVILNATDLFNVTGSVGSVANTQITIPAVNFSAIDGYTVNNIILDTAYIANIQTDFSNGTTSLPASRIGNGFALSNGNGFNNTFITNISRRDFQPVQKNLSNQYYVELNLLSTDVSLIASQVISVIRLSDGYELWNTDNVGTITTNGSNNNYQLILSGYHNPQSGDRTLIIYQANDINRFQPFTFQNTIIEKDFTTLQFDSTINKFTVDLHDFINENSVHYQILEPNTDVVLWSGNDGYIVAGTPATGATFGSLSTNFNNLVDGNGFSLTLTAKKLRIINAANRNNSNTYDITSYNVAPNLLSISNNFSQLTNKQISIIRMLDGQELWSSAGTIDLVNSRLVFPATQNATTLDKVMVLYYKVNNLKQAPTRLVMTTADQVTNPGVVVLSGTTLNKAADIVFTATASGLKQNVIEALRTALTLASNTSISSNIALARVVKLEKVTTASASDNTVLTSEVTYDVDNTTIQDNSFFINEQISDATLTAFDFVLPSTTKNTIVSNIPHIGDKLRITFYYTLTNDLESVSFTKNGTLYNNKLFALINKIYISSGFKTSQSTKLTLNNFNQPITGSRYSMTYNYTAPKINERINITYNTNQLIATTTLAIEASRPINADVLVKEASSVLVDASFNIVISSQSLNSAAVILQNVQNALTAAINATSLGTTLDATSLVNTAFGVAGVAAARVTYFNTHGKTGQVLSIQAQQNQFLVANNIIVTQVSS